MFTTAIIAFREFLEAFLIVGVFLGISKKLKLKKELEIGIASTVGFVISLVLSTIVYTFGDLARGVLTEDRSEILESYLLIFSGFFIAYVVFSLHNVIRKSRGGTLVSAHKKLQSNAFDFSLFLTIVLLVIREGCEIALFTASTSLFSVFLQNFFGLMIGFGSAAVLGVLTFITYIKFPMNKVFRATEYIIILLGASFVQNGITELLEHVFDIHLGDMLTFPLKFLPSEHTVIGHFIQSLTGLDNEFSLPRLAIMGVYIGAIYLLFLKKKEATHSSTSPKKSVK